MNSLLNVIHDASFWTVLLCVAVSVAIVTSTAVAFLLWRRQPAKKDELQNQKIHERLTQLTAVAPPDWKSNAPSSHPTGQRLG